MMISRVLSTSENLNVFFARGENFMVFMKKSKFSFYFIVYTPVRISDVITNVTPTKHKRHGIDVRCKHSM